MARNGAMTRESQDLLNREPAMTTGDFLAECDAFLARWHTMPKPLSDQRKVHLRKLKEQARQDGRMVRWIAEHLRFNPNRFSKLTSVKAEEAAA